MSERSAAQPRDGGDVEVMLGVDPSDRASVAVPLRPYLGMGPEDAPGAIAAWEMWLDRVCGGDR